jgi:hypothetical protein
VNWIRDGEAEEKLPQRVKSKASLTPGVRQSINLVWNDGVGYIPGKEKEKIFSLTRSTYCTSGVETTRREKFSPRNPLGSGEEGKKNLLVTVSGGP